MSYAQRMYALNHDQVVALAIATGATNWIHIEGLKGNGKTEIAHMLDAALPTHTLCYTDCTSLEPGDLGIPKLSDAEDKDYVRFVVNEALGLHTGKPVILLLDELPKASRGVVLPLVRLGLEREIYNAKLHPDSIVISTGNLTVEGLGDTFQDHQLDRMTIVELRTPTAMEWLSNYAIPKGLNATVCSAVKENQDLLQDWRDVPNPEDNLHIPHPQAVGRRKGVTPRGLAKAAFIMDNREGIDDHTLQAALIGTIGETAAQLIMTYSQLMNQLPSLESIKNDPTNAMIPTTASATCMVTFRALATVERDWLDAWMTYLNRLDIDAKSLFCNGVRYPKYNKKKQSMVMQNKQFTQMAIDLGYMFTADKV